MTVVARAEGYRQIEWGIDQCRELGNAASSGLPRGKFQPEGEAIDPTRDRRQQSGRLRIPVHSHAAVKESPGKELHRGC